MDKPKILKAWTIYRNIDTGEKIFHYGSYDEFTKENKGHFVEIPFENWLSEDLAEIFENELESANYHSWTWMPSKLLRTLKSNNVLEKERFNIILEMYDCWLCC